MKKITTKILSILALTLLITVTSVVAAERVKVYELAESGIIIEFPMTAEEIAAADAEKARLDSARNSRVTKPEERLHVFEMAESGQTISFPMSAEEIAAKDAEKVRYNVFATRINKPKKRVIQYELAESGLVIEFPVPEVEAVAESTDEIIGTAVKNKVDNSKN